jgi:hypothetical protein
VIPIGWLAITDLCYIKQRSNDLLLLLLMDEIIQFLACLAPRQLCLEARLLLPKKNQQVSAHDLDCKTSLLPAFFYKAGLILFLHIPETTEVGAQFNRKNLEEREGGIAYHDVVRKGLLPEEYSADQTICCVHGRNQKTTTTKANNDVVVIIFEIHDRDSPNLCWNYERHYCWD